MDFDLDEEQQALADAARSLLDDLSSSERVRGHISAGGPFDARLWAAMADQGWTSIDHPDDRGGLGLSQVEAALLYEECGAHAAPAPLAPTVLAAAALLRYGHADHADRLARAEALGCVDVRHRDVTAVVSAAGTASLSGVTSPVVGAPTADLAVVVASTGRGLGLFALELDHVHRPEVLPAMDATRNLGRLVFDDTPAWHLGDADAVADLVDRHAVAMSALLLGGSRRALELAVDHAKNREQFGKPIGAFQAVKHRCADMLVDLEGMRSVVYWAAWTLGAPPAGAVPSEAPPGAVPSEAPAGAVPSEAPAGAVMSEASISASSAVIWTADASRRIFTSTLQVLGGIGFTWDHDLHLLMKRGQLDRWSTGGADLHRDRLSTLLRNRVAAGQPVI